MIRVVFNLQLHAYMLTILQTVAVETGALIIEYLERQLISNTSIFVNDDQQDATIEVY